MPYRFVLTGTYCHFNKGDAAMQLTTAAELKKRYGDCEITVSAPFPDKDKPFYEPHRVIKCHRRNLLYGFVQCACAWLWKKCRWKAFLLDEEMRSYAEADLVIDLSGDMLTEDYGVHLAISHFLPVLLANAMGRRVFLCAQSIGPFHYTESLAKYILNHAGAVTVRDQVTMDYLESIGVAPRRLGLTGDMAFIMEPLDSDRGRSRIVDVLDQSRNGPVLGVSLSSLIEKHFKRRCPVAHQVEFWRLIAQALDRWISKYQGRVIFFAHVTGPGTDRDDREACRKVAKLMESPSGLIEEDLTPGQIKGTIRHCDLIFGARMHANIAALSSFVPTVAISYSHKTPGIMTQLECGEHVMHIEAMSPSLIDASLSRLVKERESVRAKLHQHIPEIQQGSRRNLERVEALID